MRTIKDPIQEAFNRDRRNKRRRDKRRQLAQAQPPKPVYEPVATVDTTVDAIKVPAPIDIGQGSEHEYLRPENQDADGTDTSSDADDFSAADEEPEPEPGPELTLTYTVREGYVCHFATSWDSRSRLLCSSAGVLWQVAESRAVLCPKCASPNPEGGRTCPVTIHTWDQPVCVKVPVSWCSPCGAPYNVRPTELDCLPDSKTGWNLNLHRDGQHVLWWHQPLLQVFDLVSYKSKHLSADAFCSALLDNWEQNSISRPASVYLTTLRQQLRQAFLLYLDCQGLMEDYPEGALSDWPRGALNGCPCCGDINTRSSATAIDGGVATTIPAACSDGDVGAVAAVEGLEPGGERAGVAAGSHLGAGDGDVTVPEWVPTAGSAGGPVDAEEGAAAEGLEPGGERAAVAAGSHPRGGGGGASAFPAWSASKDGLVAAAVSTGTAAIGVAALASAEWLLRDICSPEAAGPGPSILHSVHFDACFKLNLLAHKGYSPSYKQLGRRRYFLPNSSIQQVLSDGHASQQIGVTHCSNFNADKVLAAESRKNLITAVGVALCRHGMLLRLMNLFSGEWHAYSTAAALSFLAAGTAVQYWWYDIVCRWGKSYTKWLERQTPDLQRLGRELRPLIPPWHRYAHSYACQKAFGHLGVRGVGQGTGEPAEIFNSVAGRTAALHNT
ncbi:hypothetical protein Vafri_18859 [Volvox africanus]|uniref:CxC3 like cysteine cluster domain-containing protein n=1 Tax=Volvox africanus TaxID=51714 RepID=A0A8J4F947_9CHLO|nr:hypothetical protein Vafri_18859 [Volvox africanus]